MSDELLFNKYDIFSRCSGPDRNRKKASAVNSGQYAPECERR